MLRILSIISRAPPYNKLVDPSCTNVEFDRFNIALLLLTIAPLSMFKRLNTDIVVALDFSRMRAAVLIFNKLTFWIKSIEELREYIIASDVELMLDIVAFWIVMLGQFDIEIK